MTDPETTGVGPHVPAPALRVVAGRLDDAQLAALVAVVSALGDAQQRPPPTAPAWRRAALAEHSGAAPAASPRDLDARLP